MIIINLRVTYLIKNKQEKVSQSNISDLANSSNLSTELATLQKIKIR